jgi:SOS response regulatory protein OraA/RecX
MCWIKDAIKWLYPHGFNNDQEFLSSAILSATNRQVDQWNSIVQELNQTSELMELNSKDTLCEVDDPYGYLKQMRCLLKMS